MSGWKTRDSTPSSASRAPNLGWSTLRSRMPVTVTVPVGGAASVTGGVSIVVGTHPRRTRSAVPSPRSSGVSTSRPCRPRWTRLRCSTSSSGRNTPVTLTRRNSSASGSGPTSASRTASSTGSADARASSSAFVVRTWSSRSSCHCPKATSTATTVITSACPASATGRVSVRSAEEAPLTSRRGRGRRGHRAGPRPHPGRRSAAGTRVRPPRAPRSG